MKANRILVLVIFSMFIGFSAESQIKKAEKYYQFFNYSKAIPILLEEAESENSPSKYKATEMLADCYRHTNNAGLAKVWYEKAMGFDKINPINYYYLGQACRTLGLYEEAAQAFLSFKLHHPDTLNAQKYYNYSVEIRNWLRLPPSAEIKNAETINSRFSEFSPAQYKNGFVFATDRINDQMDNRYGWTNFSYLDLYYTEPEYFMNFWSPLKPTIKLNSKFDHEYHNGPAVFTSDNKWVFVTRTTRKEARKGNDNIRTSELKIFYSTIENDKPSAFLSLPFNNENYSVAHPALSPDNQSLIFSSDMPGGFGGTDLYLTHWTGGKWSNPVNLGSNVNSQGNDVFPFWAADSVLFYSSDDLMGYGGLDIFRTVIQADSTWSVPENLKAPINSSYDDFGIFLADNLKEGFFSSNRPDGKGNDDVYSFRNLKIVEPEKHFFVSGFVKDAKTGEPLNNSTVFILDSNSNKVHIAKTNNQGLFESEAERNQVYFAKALKDSFLYDCLSFRTPANDVNSFTIPENLLLNKIEIEFKSQVKIHYDLDKWEIREDAKPTLDSLVQFMNESPIRAELSSHTDSRANAEYNLQLSQKRADAAVQYIISKGIAADRIVSKGYGESNLLNKCADGISCSEEEHQQNRRTEFKIIGVDQRLLSNKKYNLNVFRSGDILSPGILETDFFDNCKAID